MCLIRTCKDGTSGTSWGHMRECRNSSTDFNTGTKLKRVVNYTPLPLYPPSKCPRFPTVQELSGPQSQSGHCGEEKNLLPLPGIKNKIEWKTAYIKHEAKKKANVKHLDQVMFGRKLLYHAHIGYTRILQHSSWSIPVSLWILLKFYCNNKMGTEKDVTSYTFWSIS
jgi:hypothetical protein